MYESPCVPNKCYYSKMLLLTATLDQKECEIAYKKTTELLYNGFFFAQYVCIINFHTVNYGNFIHYFYVKITKNRFCMSNPVSKLRFTLRMVVKDHVLSA